MSEINRKENDIKYAIRNNSPIEEKLHVIAVVSNPCLYKRRYTLLNEFVERMETEENVILYIVELIYKNQTFAVTDKNNKNHLQLETETPLWHKENMINLGVKLLPVDYKAFAWIDADIAFENNDWALDTLKILNGSKDVVQLFSHCVNMTRDERVLRYNNSFGYCHSKKKPYSTSLLDFWHPGYAWAITRSAYEKIGGLYEKSILGSSDTVMALSFVNEAGKSLDKRFTNDYNNDVFEYQKKASTLQLGYVPGVITHFFHGTIENRKYVERWQILMKHKYSPREHLDYDNGLLIPSKSFSEDFKKDILSYFQDRKEDD